MRKQIVLFLMVIFSGNLFTQNHLLSEAISLFNDGKYSASQSILNQLAKENPTEEIMYLNAKCSKELFLNDAIFLYNNLTNTFPYHQFKDEMYQDLGLIYYREKRFPDAISSFLMVNVLSTDQLFKLAYSYFSIDSLLDAQLYFAKIMNTKSKFAAASKYYYAYIAYQKGLYQSSLISFKQLLNDDKFGAIVPYYISQIYFFQKKYNSLIEFAEPLSENVIASRKSEINRLLAEAYYRLGSFSKAIKYFEVHLNEEREASALLYFLLGYSYFKSENYEKAITYLERVSNSPDSVMQYSSYYLAASYLESKNYNYALQAFKKSSSYTYDMSLAEDAYFNYAKLSYQLDLPYDKTLKILTIYLETFNNPISIPHIKNLIVQTLQATSQYSEAFMVLKDNKSPSSEQKRAIQQLAFFLGVKEFNQQDFKKALNYFTHANKYPINQVYSYLTNFWMADCYYHLNEYDKSIEVYNRMSTSVDKNIIDYANLRLYNLAYSYFQIQDYVNSLKWFRSYEKVVADSIKMNDTYLRIADAYFMRNNFHLSSKYYVKALSCGHFDIDYALYQNSISLGLIEKDTLKVNCLKDIINKFPNSSYYDNALYDLAEYYKNIGIYKLAQTYYDSLIFCSNDDDLAASSYLSIGMIFFNSSKIELAIEKFLFVVNNYQKTKFLKEALSALKSAYSTLGEVDKYLSLIESLPDVSITEAEQDSLIFSAAFMKFSEMDYQVANDAFNKYLQKFEKGIFMMDATYYYAISSLKLGDTISAINSYKKILESNSSSFKENSLIFLARRSYNLNDYTQSNIYYMKLLEFASSNAIKRETIIRLMICNEFSDSIMALKYAKQVLEIEKIDNWLLSKAYIIIARDEFSSGNYAKSKSTFKLVSELSSYDEGAEAKYYLAFLTYLDDDLALAEQLIFALAENYSNDHFIAKSFILLSDIYLAQGNNFQAKATLESIIENHDDEALVNIARKKWEIILEGENQFSPLIQREKKSFIEISEDDFEYEVKEIDDDYIVPLPDTLLKVKDSIENVNKNILNNEFE